MTTQEKLNALSKTDLFGSVAEAALYQLATSARERRLTRGEVLFSAGDKANGLFVIVSGTLRAFRQTREGREQTMHVEGPSATLAEVPVFDGGPYLSTVQAEEDSVVLFVPQQSIRLFLTKNPEAALAALAVLARRLRSVSGLAEQLALKDVAQRLAAMLTQEAVSHAGELIDGISFSLPLPHQSIAARLGSVREVINRQLHKLIEDKVISVHGHRITVLVAAGSSVPAANAELDLRQVPRPERHPLVFARFDALGIGESFDLVNDRNPIPLHRQMDALRTGQAASYLEQGPDAFRIRVLRIAPLSGPAIPASPRTEKLLGIERDSAVNRPNGQSPHAPLTPANR